MAARRWYASGRLLTEIPVAYPLSNVLIDALPEDSRKRLLANLKRTPIPVRTSIYEPGDMPRYVHFLTSGIASIVTPMENGDTTEVGTVGREGFPQGLHLMGSSLVPTRCFMQIAGTALRTDFSSFEKLFNSDEWLRRAVMNYAQYQSLLLGQIAGCNRLHDVEARLARWLLMIQDRTATTLLKLTQEFLGQMIGSQRTTVSSVAGALQARGIIEYRRGNVKVLDRTGLENTACECYPITRRLLEGLYHKANERLFDEGTEPQ
jgi:CRP-like cAMP-binding protein